CQATPAVTSQGVPRGDLIRGESKSATSKAMTWALHTIDHIIAEKHGGTTAAENLALACTLCNSRKGSDLTSIDEQTGAIEPLFHPRRDRWVDHFQLVGGRIEPRTAKGRTTTRLLRLNDSDRVEERELLIATGSIREPTA
ncbi:MAG: HNH endonuclease, partial [Isosphaeraceae bacterium]